MGMQNIWQAGPGNWFQSQLPLAVVGVGMLMACGCKVNLFFCWGGGRVHQLWLVCLVVFAMGGGAASVGWCCNRCGVWRYVLPRQRMVYRNVVNLYDKFILCLFIATFWIWDLGSSAFFNPWSGIGFSWIPDPKPIFLRAWWLFFGEKRYDKKFFCCFWIWDLGWV
jgi:hypothetical protein